MCFPCYQLDITQNERRQIPKTAEPKSLKIVFKVYFKIQKNYWYIRLICSQLINWTGQWDMHKRQTHTHHVKQIGFIQDPKLQFGEGVKKVDINESMNYKWKLSLFDPNIELNSSNKFLNLLRLF